MSHISHSFLQPSISNLSLDISEIVKKEPISYANSLSSLDELPFEVEMIKDKYQKEYNRFHKAHHQRSKSQMDKINKIIQDANDLHSALNRKNELDLRKNKNIEID